MPSVSRSFRGFSGGRFGIYVKGATRIANKISSKGKAFERGINLAANIVGVIVEAEAKRLVKHGYYRPAIDTGTLRRAITHIKKRANPYEVLVLVGIGKGVPYAIYVHEGTWFMERRPFLSDALKNKTGEILAVIRKAYGFSSGI